MISPPFPDGRIILGAWTSANEVARPLGIEDMIRLWLDPAGADGARAITHASRA
jgi:hypothetical protein